MAQDYTDLFNIPSVKERKNYVEENDPDLGNAQALKALSNRGEVPPMTTSAPVRDIAPEWKPKKLVGDPTEMLRESMNSTPVAPTVGEQAITPPEEINQTPMGETAKPVQQSEMPTMNVGGKFTSDPEEKKDKVEAVKDQTSKGSDPGIWGQLIVGLTPYALEGIFGGGKWMGSAGKGSAEGMKIHTAMEKQRRKEATDAETLKVKQQLSRDELNRKTTEATSKEKLERDKMAAPNYTQVKTSINPITKENVYSAMNAKDASWKTSDLVAPEKAEDTRNINSKAYLELRKEQFKEVQKMNDMKLKEAVDKDTSGYRARKLTIEQTENRVANSPNFYKNVTDPKANTPEAQLDKSAIQNLISTDMFASGGKALSKTEAQLVAGPTGIVPFGDWYDKEGINKWLTANPDNVKTYLRIVKERYNSELATKGRANTTNTGENYFTKVTGDLSLKTPQVNEKHTDEDKKYIQWAKENPNNPTAIGILKANGIIQ